MLAQQADAFIGFRVPEPVKQQWVELAKRESRSLSNWIQLQVQQAKQAGPDSPTREDRRRGRKSAD